MIPKRKSQRWDRELKDLTSDCENCDFYRKITFSEYVGKLCGFGVAFKILIQPKKELTKCRIKKRTPTRHSVDYLDEIIPITLKKAEEEYELQQRFPIPRQLNLF